MATSLLKKAHLLMKVTHKPQVARILLTRFCTESHSNGKKSETDASQATPERLSTATEGALRKFDKLVEKMKSQQTSPMAEQDNPGNEMNESFATMLRKSQLVALGEDEGKRVDGKIIEVMDDDLYIDFGGKFHCVCPRPRKNGGLYQRGTEVVVVLKSQEMSSAFLGSDTHITLLEADAILLGMKSIPKARRS